MTGFYLAEFSVRRSPPPRRTQLTPSPLFRSRTSPFATDALESEPPTLPVSCVPLAFHDPNEN